MASLTPAQTIDSLIKLGTLIADKKGATDWNTFLQSSDYQNIQQAAQQLAQGLDQQTIQSTISVIISKQQAILPSNGSLIDLPTDQLLQYSALGNLKLKLQATAGYGGNMGAFGGWLVNDALPTILQVAPVVIPLLLAA